MNKVVLAVVLGAVVGLTGCGNFSESAEYKEFKAFVEKCRKNPETAACKEWAESKNSPTGN